MKMFTCSVLLAISAAAWPAEPLRLESEFSIEEIAWVKKPGDSSVTGTAFLKLKDGTSKGCAGFGVELLPVAKYSSERVFRTYGNNANGQVLLEDKPPKFTPDAREYHEMLLKSVCNERNEFVFNNVPAGDYYVIAFIIWDAKEGDSTTKTGGGAMKRIQVKPGSQQVVEIKP